MLQFLKKIKTPGDIILHLCTKNLHDITPNCLRLAIAHALLDICLNEKKVCVRFTSLNKAQLFIEIY